MKPKSTKTLTVIGLLLISCFLSFVTFPEFYPPYTKGMDESLVWVFNYLFENNLALGKQIIFPHGPLAFFMYPTIDTIYLVALVTVFLKTILVFSLFQLLRIEQKKFIWSTTLVIAYGFCVLASFNQLILIAILLSYCNFFHTRKSYFKFLAFLLTAFGLYCKAYVGIIGFIIFLSFTGYFLYVTRKIKTFLLDGLVLIIFVFSFWLLMFKTPVGLFTYLRGLIELANDNSSAVAFYTYNNWTLLSLFYILLIFLFVYNKEKKTGFYATLVGLSIFAAWKHGMAREDMPHTWNFLKYVAICLTIFILFIKNKIYINTFLAFAILFCFVLNLRFIYSPWRPELYRGNYFFQLVSNFQEMKSHLQQKAQKNSASNLLSPALRAMLSSSKTDIYPWDYSIIAANNLNWQPRVVIQSYASYTSWLDSMNAAHFRSTDAPDYLIWQQDKITSGANGELYTGLDHRYLMNDEPQTIIQLLKNYDFFSGDKKFLILKKRETSLLTSHNIIKTDVSTWSNWIPVPPVKDHLLRAKLTFDKNIAEQLKSFFFKDEQFWIYLKLKNGIIHKYRIVPKNAADGIWITPYIYDIDRIYDVKEVMFKCSSQDLLTDKIAVSWEGIQFSSTNNPALSFFQNPKTFVDTSIFNFSTSFENDPVEQKRIANSKKETSDDAFTGKKSQLLLGNSQSTILSISLDSIPSQKLRIITNWWMKAAHYKYTNNLSMLVTISDSTKIIFKRNFLLENQLIDTDHWNNLLYFIDYHHLIPNGNLTVSIKNGSDNPILIDDFRLFMSKQPTVQ